ncbi:uncharacterized protein [Diadema setosum]|uniref:uncharacterized protein n=1 Tax=Diadema setosum TaxID=31175 RepID=UPI003B3ADBF7
MDRIGLSTSALTVVIILSQYATWSGATCPAPSVDHSLVAYNNQQQTYDSETQLTLECKFSNKSIEVFCNGTTGQWEADTLSNADREFQCPVNPAASSFCLPPNVNASVATYAPMKEVYAADEELTIECKYSTHRPEIYCDGDRGIWRDIPVLVKYGLGVFASTISCPDSPQPCASLSLDSSRVGILGNPLTSYPPGSDVTLECKYTGENVSTQCEVTGEWTRFNCQKDPALGPHCGPPLVYYGDTFTYDVHQDAYAHGSRLTVSCKHSRDTAEIICDAYDGMWSFSSPAVSKLECPVGTDPGLLGGILGGLFVVKIIIIM